MTTTVTSQIKILERLLRKITDAAYSVLCESNGLSDNEWKTAKGTFTPRWPVGSYPRALRKLDAAYSEAKGYFEPSKEELSEKWRDACATASYIMDRYKADRQAAAESSSNLIDSHLHRNIADAIYGVVKQTADDRAKGKPPSTMQDKLTQLVADGKLVKIEPAA